MGIPTIGREVFVYDGRLFTSPIGILNEPVGQDFSLDKLRLPSNNTPYGGAVYQYFGEVLERAIGNTLKTDQKYIGMSEPEARKRVVADYTRGQLEAAVHLLQTLDATFISGLQQRVLADYDGHGLPAQELFGSKLSEEGRSKVVEQFVQRVIVEQLSQPIRRVYALFTHNLFKRGSVDQEAMTPIIREFIEKYKEMLRAGSLIPLAAKKSQEFATGLEEMLNNNWDDINF